MKNSIPSHSLLSTEYGWLTALRNNRYKNTGTPLNSNNFYKPIIFYYIKINHGQISILFILMAISVAENVKTNSWPNRRFISLIFVS